MLFDELLTRVVLKICTEEHENFHVKFPLLLYNIISMCQQILVKLPNIKFHENLPRGSRVHRCAQMKGRRGKQPDRYCEANKRISASFHCKGLKLKGR
jgi:hypothetical protein